jgi:tetratricopeptide (TPR) repeat protein
MRAARALIAVPDSDGPIRVDLALAIEASPLDPMGYLMRARYNLERHPDEREQIRRDYEKALALNPNDLDTRLEYAKALENFGDSNAAAVQYREALKTHEGFDPAEPKRLSPEKLDEIRKKI